MNVVAPTPKRLRNSVKRRPRVLLITPFHELNRGNAVTAARIRDGLAALGWSVDFCSLAARQNRELLAQWADSDAGGLVHGFHALHTGRTLAEFPGLRRYPLALTMTGTDLHSLEGGKGTAALTPVLDLATALVVFNADYVSLLNGLNPVWGGKTVLIPQGVALPEGRALTRKELNLAEDDVVFILPSGLRVIKNIAMAVDAFNLVSATGAKVKLLIAGPILEPAYAEPLLKRCAANPRIKYLGALDHKEMKSLLSLTDVVLNCSRAEGQPQAVLEAMSLGKPGLLTAVPGNLGIIEDYREGIYVRDAAALAQAMEFCLRQPEKRQAMGLAAQALVERRFAAEREINLYDQLYRQIQLS